MHATTATISAVSTVRGDRKESESTPVRKCPAGRQLEKSRARPPIHTIAFDFQRDFGTVVRIGECDAEIAGHKHEVGFNLCKLGRTFHVRF